jgi:uncharacterized membrane protein YphA (DoxX/SURF4 family)
MFSDLHKTVRREEHPLGAFWPSQVEETGKLLRFEGAMTISFQLSRLTVIGIALVRIYTGLYWLDKGVRQKMFDPTWSGSHGDCAFVVNDMLSKAPAFYHAFLQSVVLPNIDTFAHLVEWGEALVGASLLLGLVSRWGSIGGLFLVTNYFLGNGAGALHDGWFGIDVVTFVMTLWNFILPTGLFFGLDGAIQKWRTVSLPGEGRE